MNVTRGFLGGVAIGLFLLTIVSAATVKYSGGTGEPNDPYQIATAADLIALGETPEDYDKHFILTADIDLDPNLPGRKVFDKAIIAPDANDLQMGFQGTAFTGVFDGNGRTISHLNIRGASYLGLFGRFGAYRSRPTVKELSMVDVNVTGSGSLAGGLVAYNDGGTVTRSHATGVVNGSGYVGGLVGYNYGGTVTRCGSAGVVKGKVDVGGLVGLSEGSGAVIQCYSESVVSGNLGIGGLVGRNQGAATQSYSTGVVNGTGDRPESIGGLVGANWDGNVTQCYSRAAVNGYYAVGGLVGWNGGDVTQCYSTGKVVSEARPVAGLVGDSTGYATAIRSFWDTQTSGQTKSSAGVGKTTAQMQTASTFLDAGWDFAGETANGTEDVWWIDEGKDYPRLWWEKYSGGSGTADDPYQIATAADLIALGERPEDYDKHFIMTADIDLDPNLPGGRVFDRAVIAPDVNDTEYWFQGTPFSGTFDGGGHTIRHLTITDPNHDCLGLFGMIGPTGQVRNLILEDAEISGGYHSINVGTLAGCNAGTLAECSATGIAIGCGNVRALAGSNSGTITNCHAEVSVHWLCE